MRKIGARVLFAVGALVAAYIVYVHAAALHGALARARGVAWSMRFPEPAAFTRDLDTDKTPDFSVDVGVGSVRVERTGPPGDGHAKFLTKPFYFEGGAARLRFRVRERDSYDVFVGLERADAPDKRLWLVLRNDHDHPSFRLEGTDALRGPAPPESLLDYVDGAGAIAGGDEWHTLVVRFDAASQMTEVAIDDVPVASRLLGWAGGFDARIVFGVRDRHAASVGVEIGEVDWRPDAGREPERVPDFEDAFTSARLDPLRWQAFFQKEWRVDGGIAPFETGRGLVLHGRSASQSAPGIMTPVQICTLPFALTPTYLEVDWDAEVLDHADAFVSLANVNGSRAIEIELANRGGDTRQLIVRGQLDGKIIADSFDGPALPSGPTHLRVTYDSWFRNLHVSNDDTKLFEHAFGLQRSEFSRVCVGVNVHPEGRADVVLQRFFLHRAPY